MSDRDVTCVPDDYTARLMAEVARLQGENAKLLKELEAEHALAETLGHYHEDAKAENAKLRELVRDMWNWLAPTAVGGAAPLKGLHDFMRDLGIEVDE